MRHNASYLILLLMLTISTILNAQWTNIYTYEDNGLYAIECLNIDTVFVAGENSTILYTYDKGQTWQQINLGFDIYVNDINFPNQSTGYIIGPNGKAAKTTDYGATWELLIIDSDYRLDEAIFSHPDSGIIIANDLILGYTGGAIFQTNNGGINWSKKYYEDFEFFDIESISNDKVFIGIKNTNWSNDDYGFLITENGGESWNLSNPEFDGINTISFVNQEIGYCTSFMNGLFKTINCGSTWEFITDNFNIGYYSRSQLVYLTEEIGFFAGWEYTFDNGKICRTNDGGFTWLDQINDKFWDIDMISADTGYAITYNGNIYSTTNGGTPVNINTNNYNDKIISLFPCPCTSKSVLNLNSTLLNEQNHIDFLLYDYSGKVHLQLINIKTPITEISCESLLTGQYIYLITINSTTQYVGKFIIK